MRRHASIRRPEREQRLPPNWKTQINDLLLKIYSGELTLDQGLADMQTLVDSAKAP